MKKEIYLILHNIRSLHNVGSIFRTADGAGVEKIFLTGYTPSPLDMFGKTRKKIAKIALGAEKSVPWEKHQDIGKLITKLKNYRDRISIVGVEQSDKAVDYRKYRTKYPLALIMGNEVRGLSKQALKKCDKIIEVPMYGEKESLNVAVTTGIVLFNLV
ncbi:TrmH family RNA methyltransferase [Patescibacteria group bacterium]